MIKFKIVNDGSEANPWNVYEWEEPLRWFHRGRWRGIQCCRTESQARDYVWLKSKKPTVSLFFDEYGNQESGY